MMEMLVILIEFADSVLLQNYKLIKLGRNQGNGKTIATDRCWSEDTGWEMLLLNPRNPQPK